MQGIPYEGEEKILYNNDHSGPFLFASILILPAYVSKMEDTDIKNIAVIDSSHIFTGKITDTEFLKFTYLEASGFQELKHDFSQKGYWGILYIEPSITCSSGAVELISYNQPALSMKLYIKNILEKELEKQKLLAHHIENLDQILKSIKTDIRIKIIQLSEKGKEHESSMEFNMFLGYIGGFLIYFFIFLFGSQVMRGVIEEKTNRIIEVIISSVKPFQLMVGKIVGIGMVGLTQFLIWIILTFGFVNISQQLFYPGKSSNEQISSGDFMRKDAFTPTQNTPSVQSEEVASALGSLHEINFGFMIGAFLFFFLGGYLLYAALFAAIGSAVDQDTDIQQFILPVTVPLILAIVVLINTISNPESQLSFWFSMIPFTSPVIMMARIPFGVPYFQIILSGSILIISFIAMTWMAGKIYKTGILMYGKKATYKEIWKWLNYKN